MKIFGAEWDKDNSNRVINLGEKKVTESVRKTIKHDLKEWFDYLRNGQADKDFNTHHIFSLSDDDLLDFSLELVKLQYQKEGSVPGHFHLHTGAGSTLSLKTEATKVEINSSSGNTIQIEATGDVEAFNWGAGNLSFQGDKLTIFNNRFSGGEDEHTSAKA